MPHSNIVTPDFGNGVVRNPRAELRQNLTNDVIEADRACALRKQQVEALGFTTEELIVVSLFALAKSEAGIARYKLNAEFPLPGAA